MDIVYLNSVGQEYISKGMQTQLEAYLEEYNIRVGERYIAVVALSSGALKGVGIIEQRKFHSAREYIVLHVAENVRRRGIASSILNRLQALSARQKLQCLTSATDHALIGFLLKNRFSLARKTYEVEIDQKLSAPSDLQGFQVRAFSQLNNKDLEEVERLLFLNYKKYHASVNAIADGFTPSWFFERIKDSINMVASKALLVSSKDTGSYPVVAYFIVGEELADAIEVAYFGGKNEADVEVYRAFFYQEANVLLTRRAKVFFEADDTDVYMNRLVGDLANPAKWQYGTYVKNLS
ncbi:GNAT family N-acetyltransferase [Pseudomonas sp. 5P_3.1_Bac2]|uniref:GNAT family N-acetyltransferase n=1 Tax=Pseudomonas sp. 5P_3.1_Bac2 TaxID=2971617 RepID=UPI0021C75AA7|nr:GNAT family N-acetyltransferase [Pseudomonas sp. 5P_3.1_Bac2]MCU1718394.1 hypothetical protein [Pseudomonas sp. 5P_3.1_Bac2]